MSRFSSRVPADLAPNDLARAVAERRARNGPLIDLTESNPTRAGFDYQSDLLAPLADPRALVYEPQPFGLAAARQAVADDYRRRGIDVAVDRIGLTASTSDAYALLFKLLCDPGDDVLVPRPSYPLFDHLTLLEGVGARPYDLDYHGRWTIDISSLERAFGPRTRAVLIVSPNNPTGSFLTADELDAVTDLCAAHGAALIADEVFADYPLATDQSGTRAQLLGHRSVLTFALGGLSKCVGLPQVKLGWFAVDGPSAEVSGAMDRLELICDTYLSVSTPVQVAAGALLEAGAVVRRQIQARIAANYATFVECARTAPSCCALNADGGWYAILQVPTIEREEALILALVSEEGVLVHPGYFFDFPRETFLIVSLLPREEQFREGIDHILRRIARLSGGPQ